MDKRIRAVYTREEGKTFFRFLGTEATLERILTTGRINAIPIAYLQWAHGNYDFKLKRPRVQPFEPSILALYYPADWEKMDPQPLPLENP